ncbi:flippase [Candidatus Woesearchaeota archaeon]|nr:flippase [Candidatus Woesearchaeota archaeon]
MINYTKFAVKGASIVLIFSLVAAFFGYLVRLILARGLSIEEFGLFYSIFAFLGMFGAFKSLGLDKALVKFIPEFKHKKQFGKIKSAMIYSIFVQFVTNILILIFVYAFSKFLSDNYFHDPRADIILKLMAIALFIDGFISIIKFSFQGFKKMVYFSNIDLVRMVIIVLTIAIGFKLNYGILSPVIAYLLSPIILIIIFGFILIKKVFPEFSKSKFLVEKKLMKSVSKYGIFVMATTVGAIVLGYTDIIMLTYFSGLTAVGLYSVALPTSKIFLFFPRALGGVLFPLTSEFWTAGKKSLIKEGLESLFKYSMIIIVPSVLVMFSFSDILINLLFGTSYISASDTLKILSIGMIFGTLSGISTNFFSGIGKPQINSKIIYAAAIFNLIINLVLIPVWGIIGAAISTTISYIIMAVLGLTKIKKFIVLSLPIRYWMKTLVAGIILTLSIHLLKKTIHWNVFFETVLILILSSVVYVSCLFLFKVITMKEIKELYSRITN